MYVMLHNSECSYTTEKIGLFRNLHLEKCTSVRRLLSKKSIHAQSDVLGLFETKVLQ